MKEALLVVDVQYDFLPGGALGIEKGDEILPVINELLGKYDFTIMTQDWHPEGHVSFASTHGKKAGETIEVKGLIQDLWPDHCIQHTHGAAIAKEIHRDHIDKYIHKGIDQEIDSYSAFFDNGHTRETELNHYLREKGVTKLYIVGLATDFCVYFTVLDALELGYEVVVIAKGCRAVFDHEGALNKMEEAGAEIQG